MEKEFKNDRDALLKEKEAILKKIRQTAIEDDMYDVYLEKLSLIEDALKKRRKISNETKALIIANLLGIGMILGFEKAHIITTKALGFISKPRI